MPNGSGGFDVWHWILSGITALFTATTASHIKTRDRVQKLETKVEGIESKTQLIEDTSLAVARLEVSVTNLEEDVKETSANTAQVLTKIGSIERLFKLED